MHGKEVPERGQSMSPFPAENDEISDISKSVYHFMPFSSHDSEVKCGQAVPKRSHGGLGERFWTTDTEILFQRYWWTTRRFFHQKLESHWSILSTASEKLAQQYFFGHSHRSSASWKQTTRKTTQDKRSSIDPHVESHWAILFATFSRTGRNLPAILGPTSSWRLIRITRNPWSEPARNLWKSTENRNIKIIKHQQEPPKSCILMKKCSKELCLSAWFIFTCPSLIGSLSPGIWILSWRWEFRNV